jgi:hypothetical protein
MEKVTETIEETDWSAMDVRKRWKAAADANGSVPAFYRSK